MGGGGSEGEGEDSPVTMHDVIFAFAFAVCK